MIASDVGRRLPARNWDEAGATLRATDEFAPPGLRGVGSGIPARVP